MLKPSRRTERHARIARDLAVGPPVEKPFGDTITLYVFLAIVVFIFAWFLSDALLWSIVVVGAILVAATALTWWARQRRLRRSGPW